MKHRQRNCKHRNNHGPNTTSTCENQNQHRQQKLSKCGFKTKENGIFQYRLVVASPETNLDEKTKQAMIDSLKDEYHARAFYNAVIAKFGEINPFRKILESEERHVQRWHKLFRRYGLSIPKDDFTGNITAPENVVAACEMAIASEIANGEMYSKFLEFITEPDLRNTWLKLRHVSETRHKIAFERCLNSLKS